ncbi:MAG: hypothetical protein UU42_C0007G0022 [Candidatus Woesebacteria bacterium GW2011_GWA1_41_13b]|uniref:Uncharacterized protein n=1 Tax=Candidatus Woesebacteria bacterium GW2011_GWA1_41_13b TaxID=1618555 RepID=A0A0G0X570_9BACT|nr:MAG: hypothetical protein UU42_C0007G0022 [Candidatus Woesebacteria bacterium GW2011_GWA1_41_13b]
MKCYRFAGLDKICYTILVIMKFLNFFRKQEKRSKKGLTDFYQDSIEKLGRDQIKKLVDRGLSIPVFML